MSMSYALWIYSARSTFREQHFAALPALMFATVLLAPVSFVPADSRLRRLDAARR
jgi:hypothetical protein